LDNLLELVSGLGVKNVYRVVRCVAVDRRRTEHAEHTRAVSCVLVSPQKTVHSQYPRKQDAVHSAGLSAVW
jgi:hypothetical protein